jgi:iron complex outermembrane receptor protein
LQYRSISYSANGNLKGPEPISIDENYGFFNPKAGLVYTHTPSNKFYISLARAHREPSRSDFENGNPQPEELNDYELGWRFNTEKTNLLVNFYFMDYTNQLALTGALDDVGSPIRENIGKSSRLGIEIEGTFLLANRWTWQPNLTLSRNRNHDFYFQRDGILADLGDTHLSFSPAMVAGNIIAFQPSTQWKIALLTKHVGEQYMGNIDAQSSKLEAYTVSDLNVNYRILPKILFKEINISLLLNNLLGTKYVSNGYFYTSDDDYSVPGLVSTIEGAGYYPQARFNFLGGINLRF